jgi:hypothetical protein
MTWTRWLVAVGAAVTAVWLAQGVASAQAPYGYGLRNGQVGAGYMAGYQLSPRSGYGYGARGAGTVTDYQSLINAITQIPGWYGPTSGGHRPAQPQPRPRPTVARSSLLADDGTILWPSATPNDASVAETKRSAEAATRAAVRDQKAYGHASIREVVDARNKLKAFAGRALPALKARNAADADGLERFIVELQKTLATLAENY